MTPLNRVPRIGDVKLKGAGGLENVFNGLHTGNHSGTFNGT